MCNHLGWKLEIRCNPDENPDVQNLIRPSFITLYVAPTAAGWPKLIKQVVMASPDKGAAVVLLLPATATLADGSTVKVDTTYPFEDTVKVMMDCSSVTMTLITSDRGSNGPPSITMALITCHYPPS